MTEHRGELPDPRLRSRPPLRAGLACALPFLIAVLALATDISASGRSIDVEQAASANSGDGRTMLPVVARAVLSPTPVVCQATGSTYSTLTISGSPTDRPAELHADLNLALRGYRSTSAALGLVHYNAGPTPDQNAPQLPGLFSDQRTAAITGAYQVYDWNWSCNCLGAPLIGSGIPPDLFAVTLIDLTATPGETLNVPQAGYSIGDGFQVLVLYATSDRLTLKYTREDNVISGYTIHLEHVCTDPALLALYNDRNAAGRGTLPALQPRQPLGRARGSAVGVAIRDSGTFMDPRSAGDWWIGRGPIIEYLASPAGR